MIYKAKPIYHNFTSIPDEFWVIVENNEIVSYKGSNYQNAGTIHSYDCYSESQYKDFLNYKENFIKRVHPELYEQIKNIPEKAWKSAK